MECNRCLDPFFLPVADEQRLLVKFGEPNEEDPDVIYIPYGTTQLSVAQYLYEFILLSIPLAPTHEDANEACNPEMVKYLTSPPEAEAAPESPDAETPSPWAALKQFKSS